MEVQRVVKEDKMIERVFKIRMTEEEFRELERDYNISTRNLAAYSHGECTILLHDPLPQLAMKIMNAM